MSCPTSRAVSGNTSLTRTRAHSQRNSQRTHVCVQPPALVLAVALTRTHARPLTATVAAALSRRRSPSPSRVLPVPAQRTRTRPRHHHHSLPPSPPLPCCVTTWAMAPGLMYGIPDSFQQCCESSSPSVHVDSSRVTLCHVVRKGTK